MCLPMEGKRLDALEIPLMAKSDDHTRCAFTISVDAKKEVTTGVSAQDRATTIKALIDPASKPADFHKPGHIFPLRAKENGVLQREGHTEAAIDFCKLASLYPAAIIAEIMKDNGEMAKLDDLENFAGQHKLGIYSIKDLIAYRKADV